jgi:hypothetical protein
MASRLHDAIDMRDATLTPVNDSAVEAWLRVEPDEYLDARKPEWRVYEVAGLVRFVRNAGEARGRLVVAPSATEIFDALLARPYGAPSR